MTIQKHTAAAVQELAENLPTAFQNLRLLSECLQARLAPFVISYQH